MSNFQKYHKHTKFGFGDVNQGRQARMENKKILRKNQRENFFNGKRNVMDSSFENDAPLSPIKEDRLTRLTKWKADRDKLKSQEVAKKKPPFKVGIVHHKVYSPLNTEETQSKVPKVKKNDNTIAKRITRATEKRLLAKTKSVTAKSTTKKKVQQKNKKEIQKSFASANHKFRPPSGVVEVPLFGRVPVLDMTASRISDLVAITPNMESTKVTKFMPRIINIEKLVPKEPSTPTGVTDHHETKDTSLDSTKIMLPLTEDTSSPENIEEVEDKRDSSLNVNDTKKSSVVKDNATLISSDSPNEPAFFSPYVVSSRGKKNARKEQQLRRGFSLNRSTDDDIPTKENVMKNLNVSAEEEERTSNYFLFLLNKETERLNELCNKWTKIKLEPDTMEDAQHHINQAVGQTTLLINKKFERFRRLVMDCETGEGKMLVTCKDLQGFWDMMFMEINNCDTRFNKLEKLRAQDWIEEQIKPVVKKKTGGKKKTKKIVATKPSSIRSFLAEQKKKMNIGLAATNEPTVNFIKCKSPNTPNTSHKARRSVNRNNLTPVLLSEATQKLKSPLIAMRISQKCKTPTVLLDDTISYINSDQTPGKSILKVPGISKDSESRIKTTNKVNFDDTVTLNEVFIDVETRTKKNLAVALARIDSFNLDDVDEVQIKAERKLNFDVDSNDESSDTENHLEPKIKLPTKIKNILSTPTSENQNTPTIESTKSRRILRRQDAFDEGDEEEPIRVLRTRKVSTNDVSQSKKRSSRNPSKNVQESEHKENKTPKTKRKSLAKAIVEGHENSNPSVDSGDSIDQMTLNENGDKRRKSSRKSVKFTEDCTACMTDKPVLPMTPRVSRTVSKTGNSTSKRKSRISIDLISWETPEKMPPPRVRRSQAKEAL